MNNDKGTNNDLLFKALYRKLKIEQHEHQLKPEVNTGASECQAVPSLLVTSVLIIKLYTFARFYMSYFPFIREKSPPFMQC